ncbi:unnamed protein product [Cuscuta europaea]|uniref:Uncharacterized protein n=1 Tax=Cuscuta europaea TaxID=41803 RepID=A0A9P1E5L2_CUSEU|nr:unnamed protein product [Cuscuta europaea]
MHKGKISEVSLPTIDSCYLHGVAQQLRWKRMVMKASGSCGRRLPGFSLIGAQVIGNPAGLVLWNQYRRLLIIPEYSYMIKKMNVTSHCSDNYFRTDRKEKQDNYFGTEGVLFLKRHRRS